MKLPRTTGRFVSFFAALALTSASGVHGENLKTESRMPHLHHIPLRDCDGQIISLPKPFDEQGKPQEARANPYSTAQTCGKCHEYATIGKGWHFNAAKNDTKPGRPGEPWILTDPATRTQIPLSYRGWNGTFKPADLGMTDFDFITTFARHFPGGGVGEPDSAKIDQNDAKMRRLLLTGTMQIDCLICHDASGHYNHETRFRTLNPNYQNFKWAPSIAAGLGVFGGSRPAKAYADMWKPPRAIPTNMPAMKYDRAKFDADDNVAFQVTRRPSANACYYCHTSEASGGDARWHSDRDVHIRAGMSCIDCHRNGVDHMIVRGYETEAKERTITPEMVEMRLKLIRRDQANLSEAAAKTLAEQQLKQELGMVETLSCRGCHSGANDANNPIAKMGGRLGAPRPAHKGLPPVHLEKLACTACHSGPFPGAQAQPVHTALAHKLGLPGPARGENTAPVIVQPVLLRGQDGKIAPHKMVWPSYWAWRKDNKITPILPEEVTRLAQDKLPSQPSDDMERDPYNTKAWTNSQIQQVLEALANDKSHGEPVFVASGKIYSRDAAGKLQSQEHAAAAPYAWALAHDVRPAGQSVGARGCADCHSSDSPLYFGKVLARGPLEPSNALEKAMWELRGDNKTLASTFAFTFVFRPMLKYISFGSSLIIAGVLLNYGLLGLWGITGKNRKKL